MAKKKDETPKQEVELTAKETEALEIRKTVSKGEKVKDKYKLKDPSTHYAEGSFSLSGDQTKELPESPSPDLVARIRSGFIEKA